MNKPCNTGKIVRWFLILLEFDFTVVVKKGVTHEIGDHLSRLIMGEGQQGILDDFPNVCLFNVEMVPQWSKDIVPMLTIGFPHLNDSMNTNLTLIEQSRQLSMIACKLHKRGQDNVLQLCTDKQ